MFKLKLLPVIILFSSFILGQIQVDPISRPESVMPMDKLIQEVLFTGCEDISNLKVNSGEPYGFKSYGYFVKGNSNFSFEEGVVLSTGNVNAVPGPFDSGKENKRGQGEEVKYLWGGDIDLKKILDKQLGGNVPIYNSTSLEFDVIPLNDNIIIDFIFGSNEYELSGNYECIEDKISNFQDGFAFLISGPGITPDPGINKKNIALVPGSNKAVGVGTIHNNSLCKNTGRKDLYIEGKDENTIDVNGFTIPLTAKQSVIPGQKYTIKITLGERADGKYDSFIFFASNGFNFNIDLGDDKTFCTGDEYTLDAGNFNGQAIYKWYKDGNIISGENKQILKVNETGSYKSEITLSDCVLEDEVIITFDKLPAPRNVLHEECSKTQFAQFSLQSKVSEIMEEHESYVITFYKTIEDAELNINRLPDFYKNEEAETQNIYARVESKNGCVAFSRYTLKVDPIPEYSGLLSLEECDENQDDKEVFDLEPIKQELIDNSIAIGVTFHASVVQATSNVNPLPLQYETESRKIYARMFTNSDCYELVEIDLIVEKGPEIYPIEDVFCDPENDGEIIDLTAYEVDLDPALQFEYYTSENNTINQLNKINNPTSVTVITDTTYYVRTVNLTDSCETYTTITIKIELLPILDSLDVIYELCDDEYDGEVEVNLADLIVEVDPASEYIIDFYETQTEGEAEVNKIITPTFIALNDNQLVAKVFTGGKCYSYVNILFDIKDIPILKLDSVNIQYCKGNGDVIYDITSLENSFIDDTSGVVVSYHLSQPDAQNNINSIANPIEYNVNTSGNNVYVRMSSLESCFSIAEIIFDETEGPSGIDISESFCIDEGSSTVIDLTKYEGQITIDPSWVINYYESLSDAENRLDAITELEDYELFNDMTLYQRIDANSELGCYSINIFDFSVSALPFVKNINLTECEIDGDNIATFNLNDGENLIISNNEDYLFDYYKSTQDLENDVNELNELYISSGNEIIYVKVTDENAECYSIAKIELTVSGTNSSGSIEQKGCESDSDGFTTFDLSENNNSIFDLIDGTDIEYYSLLIDADAQQNELPLAYVNEMAYNQTIYAKVKDGVTCKGFVEVNLRIIENPSLIVEREVFKCSEFDIVLDAGEGHDQYEWSTGENTQQITVQNAGQYTITVYNVDGCSTTDVIEVNLYEDAQLIDLVTGSNYIEAIVENPSEYTYSIDGVNYQSNPRFVGLDASVYTVYAKNSKDCVTKLGAIGLITQDSIPNVFTPNGDGYNDYWIVEGLDAFPEAIVQVFTREGKKVLNKVVGSGFSWDGKYLGRKLPSNDYWYIIKLTDGKVFRSHITLKNR